MPPAAANRAASSRAAAAERQRERQRVASAAALATLPARGFPIRALLQVLIALVLAVTLVVVGYVVMLSLRHEPVATGTPVPMSRLPKLPDPDRLPRRASFAPASAEGPRAFPPELRPLSILVRSLPAAERATAGVAVYDDLFAHVAWLPLRDATEVDGGLRVATSAPTGRELHVVVAPAYAIARNGYWSKLDLPANLDPEAVPELDAALQDVVVHAAASSRPIANALKLRRTDDPTWVPRTAFVHGVDPDQHGQIHLRLGKGTYELLPWAEGTFAPIAITVPGPATIPADFGQ